MHRAADATTDPPARGTRLPHLPGLDGLRGLAVLGVLAFHAGLHHVRGGYLGVSAFFTLSGFLITALLLAEQGSEGRVSLRAFWARRGRRLLPAALAGVALALAFAWAEGSSNQVASLRGDAWAALGYVANWRFVLEEQSYGDWAGDPSPLLHYWSLAIEEQFYVVYPLLVAAVLRVRRPAGRHARVPDPASRRGVLAAVLGVVLAASVALAAAGVLGGDRLYFGTDARAAELAVGALLAVALYDREVTVRIRRSPSARRVIGAVGTVALVAMLAAWSVTDHASDVIYRGGLAAHAVVVAAVLLAAIVPGTPVQRLLSWRPLRAVGAVSYGLYLYHWPIFAWVDRATDLDGVALLAAQVAATVPPTLASYRWLEQPIRRRTRRLGRRPHLLLPPALAAVVAATLLVTADPPPPVIDYETAAAQELATDVGPITTVLGDPPPPTFAFFGDSTAMLTSFGVNAVAFEQRTYTLTNGETELGCGISRYGLRRHTAAQAEGEVPEVCSSWAETWAALAEAGHPSEAVIQTGPWDVLDRKLPGDDEWRHVGDPVFDEHLRSEMHAVIDLFAAECVHVIWLTSPPIGPDVELGTTGIEKHGVAAEPERMARLNELIREVVAERPDDASVVDLAGWLAERDPTHALRPDGVHFDLETTIVVAREFLTPALLEAHGEAWRADQRAGHTCVS